MHTVSRCVFDLLARAARPPINLNLLCSCESSVKHQSRSDTMHWCVRLHGDREEQSTVFGGCTNGSRALQEKTPILLGFNSLNIMTTIPTREGVDATNAYPEIMWRLLGAVLFPLLYAAQTSVHFKQDCGVRQTDGHTHTHAHTHALAAVPAVSAPQIYCRSKPRSIGHSVSLFSTQTEWEVPSESWEKLWQAMQC